MTIDTLLKSPDLYVLFDGCPTCGTENAAYLNTCRIMASQMVRRLQVVSSGSPTASLIRTIAKRQDQPITYPLLLLNGEIRHLHHQ